MRRVFFGILTILTPLFFSSCADTETKNQQNAGASSIPWNRPEKWEGQGMVPGFDMVPH